MVLTIIDRFSNFGDSIPLVKLLSAKETVEEQVREVFRTHGLPTDGTQLTAVWKAFCHTLGASVSLTSGFHPQSNGQADWANQVMEISPTTWVS